MASRISMGTAPNRLPGDTGRKSNFHNYYRQAEDSPVPLAGNFGFLALESIQSIMG
jgi:hypothetical protein